MIVERRERQNTRPSSWPRNRRRMNAVDLREVIAIVESRQEDAVVAHLHSAMLSWASPRKSPAEPDDHARRRRRTLLLNSHTDTVPVGEGWTRDPLAANIEEGKIYGRGSNDAKGCLIAMILGAKKAFASNAPKGKVLLAASCEEEVLGQGLEVLLPTLPRPDAAVVGEPTGLKAAVAQKGLLLLEIIAKGRSAHSAHGGGINAVEAARVTIGFETRPRLSPGSGSLPARHTRFPAATVTA